MQPRLKIRRQPGLQAAWKKALMRKTNTHAFRFALGLLLSLLVAETASASLGVISLEALTDQADLIVHGKVLSSSRETVTRQTAEGTRGLQISIATIRIEPVRIIKGSAPAPVLVQVVEGMEDSPRFQQGEEVIVFLQQNPDSASYSTVGLMQGKFNVADGLVLRAETPVGPFVEKLESLVTSRRTG